MTLQIRPETPEDREAIFRVTAAAFGQEAEARLVDRLRDEWFARVSLAAESQGAVVGHILFSEVQVMTIGGSLPALSLAPVSVLPEFQRRGIGAALVREGLAECRRQAGRIVVVLGHPEYYPRFGFSAELARRLGSPFGSTPAWMAMELTPGALEGVRGFVRYPPPFGVDPAVEKRLLAEFFAG